MPLNIDWQQILLHMFNTVLLLGILYFLLYKPVKQFMDKRVEYYKNMDDAAKNKQAEAETLKREYDVRLAAAEEEIKLMKELSEREIASLQRESEKQAIEQAEAIVSKAKIAAEYEKKKILHEAQTEITEIITSAAEKVAVSKDTSFNYDEFLKSALGDEVNG